MTVSFRPSVPVEEGIRNTSRPRKRWTRLRRNEALKGYLYVSPWVLGFLAFGLWPMLQTFYYSFTRFRLFADPQWIGWQNYREILTQDPIFAQACLNMLFYLGFSTLITTGGGLIFALLLNRRVAGNYVFRTIVYVPSLLAGVAIAKLFKALFATGANGVVNAVLGLLHIAPINWLSDYNHPWLALVALILVNFWFVGGSMLVFLAGLKSIPLAYYEVARIDGAGRWALFWRITLPLLTPALVFNTVLAIIGHIQTFEMPLVFASAQGSINNSMGNPLGYHNSMVVFLTYIYRRAFVQNDYGYASALSVLVFCMTLLLALIVLRTVRFAHCSDQEW